MYASADAVMVTVSDHASGDSNIPKNIATIGEVTFAGNVVSPLTP